MYVARTCAELETKENGGLEKVQMYAVRNPLTVPNHLLINGDMTSDQYKKVMDFAKGADQITFRFGIHDPKEYGAYKGNVKPICGQLTLDVKDPRVPESANPPDPGVQIMQHYYLFVISELWGRVLPGEGISNGQNFPCAVAWSYTSKDPNRDTPGKCNALPTADFKTYMQEIYRKELEAVMLDPSSSQNLVKIIGTKGAIQAQVESGRWSVGPALRQKGWAGASIWYNRLAEMNGAITSAVLNIPYPTKYPEIMEYVRDRKAQENAKITSDTGFKSDAKNNSPIQNLDPFMAQKAQALWIAYDYWQKDTVIPSSGNMLEDALTSLIGLEGLFNMRKNDSVHPLAKLVGIGRSLIDSAVNNMGYALAGGIAGKLLGSFESLTGILNIGIDLLFMVTMATISIGFVLFYIIPFLPFIYFFFAVGEWIKAIFEAMVGMPLWALAHIRIDGDGFIPQSAQQGYTILLEIFLRPILIIFGFLGSIIVFSAIVSILNITWDMVTDNLTGFNSRYAQESGGNSGSIVGHLNNFRGMIDQFFFTIMYTIVVYIMALASFKLIDQIPKQALRWMGQNANSFGQDSDADTKQFLSSSYTGFQQSLKPISGQLQSILKS
jgi:hypothetical protein